MFTLASPAQLLAHGLVPRGRGGVLRGREVDNQVLGAQKAITVNVEIAEGKAHHISPGRSLLQPLQHRRGCQLTREVQQVGCLRPAGNHSGHVGCLQTRLRGAVHNGAVELRLGHGARDGYPCGSLQAVEALPGAVLVRSRRHKRSAVEKDRWIAALRRPPQEEGVAETLGSRRPGARFHSQEDADEIACVNMELLPLVSALVELSHGSQAHDFGIHGLLRCLLQRNIEGVVTHEQQVEHDTDAPHVAAASQRLSPYAHRRRTALLRDTWHWRIQLRRRVPEGACPSRGQLAQLGRRLGRGRRATLGDRCRQDGSPTEVPKLELPMRGRDRDIIQHHVLRLHILVLYSTERQVLQRQEKLPHELRDETLREAAIRMLPGVKVVKRGAVAVLEHQHVLPTVPLVALQEPQDVTVDAHAPQGPELLLECSGPHAVEALEGHPTAPFTKTTWQVHTTASGRQQPTRLAHCPGADGGGEAL
mmetsp:Transcript_32655/g.102278  ORF Transcript_32655/g.102278 Transcript_32655/m.102278 type:complete len:477 (-) Transcript_32655:413-1843(-)